VERRVSLPGRPFLAALSIAALLVVVALASRPEGVRLQPDVGGEPARVLLDTLFYLFLLAALLGLLVAGWVLWPHPEMDLQPMSRRRWSVILAILAAVTVVVLVWWRARWGPFPNLPIGQPPGGAAGGPQQRQPGPAAARGVDWLALLLTAAAAVVAGTVLWLQLRPRRRRADERRALGEALGSVLDDAIEEVEGEQDPRRAVIAAWARTERVLSRQGLPRHAAEAPFEYAARALQELGAPAAGLQGLAWLFEWARFSLHEVTPAMREDALARLRAVREVVQLAD
jgi:hypothetical protein